MKNADWESLPIVIIAILGILGAVLIYNLINEVAATEELPEVKADPIGIVKELSGGHETVDIINETAELPTRPSKPVLTDEELIAAVVMSEAEGEPFLVKVACAICILNRCDRSGLTVETVINSPNQFAKGETPNEDCIKAAEIARKYQPLFDSRMIYFRAGYYHEKYGIPYFTCNTYFSIAEE